MNIGIDGSRAFVKDPTGTENYSFQLLKNLTIIDAKNNYLIYIREGQGLRVKGQEWPANFKFKVISLPRFWTQIGLSWRTFIDPLDVLFIPSHTLPLIRKPGLKTIITVHDLGAEYLAQFHQLKQILYLKLMTRYQLKTASKIIAVSKATKNDLVKKTGIPSEKIKVIYEGVEKNIFKPISKDIVSDILKKYDLVAEATEAAKLGKKKPLGERGKYFLFVGTIQPRKNLERLIRAFGLLVGGSAGSISRGASSVASRPPVTPEEPSSPSPLGQQKNNYQLLTTNYKLILVGQKGWKSEAIYDLPKELGIEDKVKFLGRIPVHDLVGLYSGAVALTYPSLFEGFGLPILEAFACGCPVITSDCSSMPEVAGGAALLVDPEKESEISEMMFKIASNDALRNSLIRKGYNRVKDFDWEKTAKETLEIFEEAK